LHRSAEYARREYIEVARVSIKDGKHGGREAFPKRMFGIADTFTTHKASETKIEHTNIGITFPVLSSI